MSIVSSPNTQATEMDLISQIVQAELLEKTVIMGSLTDFSGQLEPGVKSLEIPRFEADTTPGSGRLGDPNVQNPDGTTAVAFQTATLTTDVINIDDWRNLSYRIADRVRLQSRVPLEAEFARKAGQEFAIYVDRALADDLATLTSTIEYGDGSPAANNMTLENVAEARARLNRENVPDMDRVLLIPPEKERDLINLDNFRNANQYGSREALLNGEIGRIYGFRVLISNVLTEDEAYAYHPECVGFAMQKQIQFETDRPAVTLQVTDYGYSAGWGHTLMYDGKKGVRFILGV